MRMKNQTILDGQNKNLDWLVAVAFPNNKADNGWTREAILNFQHSKILFFFFYTRIPLSLSQKALKHDCNSIAKFPLCFFFSALQTFESMVLHRMKKNKLQAYVVPLFFVFEFAPTFRSAFRSEKGLFLNWCTESFPVDTLGFLTLLQLVHGKVSLGGDTNYLFSFKLCERKEPFLLPEKGTLKQIKKIHSLQMICKKKTLFVKCFIANEQM